MDRKRQDFYRAALAAAPKDAFVVIIGIGSVLPMFEVARRPAGGVLIESSTKLCKLAEELLAVNHLSLAVATVSGGLDQVEAVANALGRHVPSDARSVVIL